MTPEEFVKKLQNKSLEVERYATLEFPNMAGNITLRFINGNFRAQGFQGTTFKKWKPSKGTTLVPFNYNVFRICKIICFV